MGKKKLKTVAMVVLAGIIILFIMVDNPPYQVENVFDEIALTNKKHFWIPYTKTDFINFNASSRRDLPRDIARYFVYDKGSDWRCIWEERWGKAYIWVVEDCLDFAEVQLDCKYVFKDKAFTQRLVAYEYDENLGYDRVLSKGEMEELFRENGTSVDEVYAQARAELEKMLDEWIVSNAGKSIFSLGNYGEYVESEVEYYEPGDETETETENSDGWVL